MNDGVSWKMSLLCGFLVFHSITGWGQGQVRLTQVGKWPTWPAHTRGDARALQAVGNYLYVALGAGGVAVLDISNPAHPVRTSTYEMSDTYNFAIQGDYGYLVRGTEVVIVRNPLGTGTGKFSEVYAGSGLDNLVVDGHILYVMDYDGLQLIDVEDPSLPRLLGKHMISGVGPGMRVAAANQVAYVAASHAGLIVMDASNPSNPIRLGAFLANTVPSTEAYDVKLRDHYAFVAGGRGLWVLDVSDPAQPVTVWGNYVPQNSGLSIELAGSYAVMGSWNKVIIMDVSNPTNVAILAEHSTGGRVGDLAIRGSHIYAVSDEQTLHVIDATNPRAPRSVTTLYMAGMARDVQKDDSYLYVADSVAGLRILDSTGGTMSEIGGLRLPGAYALKIQVAGNRAYMADNYRGLQIIDVTDKRQPALLGELQFSHQSVALDVVGNYAYVAATADGLVIVDVRDPRRPVPLGRSNTNGSASDVKIQGDYAYIADYLRGLVVVDVRDPLHPVEVANVTNNMIQPSAIDVKDRYAYVLSPWTGLHVIDISQPTNPIPRGRILHPANDLFVSGNYVFLGGLAVIDVRNPDAPLPVGSKYTPGFGLGVFVQGNMAYVADGAYGVISFYFTPLPQPRIQIRSEHPSEVTLTVTDTSGVPFAVESARPVPGFPGGWHWQRIVDVYSTAPSFEFKDSAASPAQKLYRVRQHPLFNY